MTRKRARGHAAACRGYTLMEALIAMGMVSVALGTATVLLVKAHKRMRDAADAADERVQVGLAADKLLMDVRSASSAAVDSAGTGVLLLVGPDGSQILWAGVVDAPEGVLVRARLGRGEKCEIVYGFPLAEARFTAETRDGRGAFVEARLEVETRRGKAAPVYVGASTRVWGANR